MDGPTLPDFGFLTRLFRDDQPENPNKVFLLLAGLALVVALVRVVFACASWIAGNGDLGSGACWALGLSVLGLAVLAGYVSFAPGGTIAAISPKPKPGDKP